MATAFDITETLATAITVILAPYQPSTIAVPNTATTAGQIAATMIAPGHPVQIHVTTRLENSQAQVGIYEGKIEKSIEFFDGDTPVAFDTGTNSGLYEVDRATRQIVVEIWATSYPAREAILRILRQKLRGSFRQTEPDGSITLMRYTDSVPFDDEQKDSTWITQMFFMADYSVTDMEESYPVTELVIDTTEINTLNVVVNETVITLPHSS